MQSSPTSSSGETRTSRYVYGHSLATHWLNEALSWASNWPWCRKPPEPDPDDAFQDADERPPELDDGPNPAASHEESLVESMLWQHRYALLLRPQLIVNLTADQTARACEALDRGMCIVPCGEVALVRPEDQVDDEEPMSAQADPLRIEAYYLDRYPVTNSEYYRFVAGGGYEQMAIWDREIWPALLDFVDATGHPGPRFWRNGHYRKGEERHPVVGISWYEAAAYARWVGKRLPTDAEWVKAASWPLAIPGQPPLERRYPWGEAMDHTRANLWGGAGKVMAVDAFPGGASVGGVRQLIGNTWEWTADTLSTDELAGEPLSADQMMKSIRGGAYDTYLDCQATCQFQSADRALARKHNISFRCAIGWDDMSQARQAVSAAATPTEAAPELPFAEIQQ